MFKYLSAFLLFAILSCKEEKFNRTRARAFILQIQRQERQAHFTRDIKLFMSGFKDTSWMVNNGTVELFVKEKDYVSFANYFDAVEFIKWDDMQQPLISFSDDGSLACAIVQKEVIKKQKTSGRMDTMHYAWTSIYRRTAEQWLLECNISTNQ